MKRAHRGDGLWWCEDAFASQIAASRRPMWKSHREWRACKLLGHDCGTPHLTSTMLKVCHNGCVVVPINDRGPFVAGSTGSCASDWPKSNRPCFIEPRRKHNGRAEARPLRSQCCYL